MSQPSWLSEITFPEWEARPKRLGAVRPDFAIRGMAYQVTVQLVHRYAGARAVEDVLTAAGISERAFGILRKYPLSDYMRLALAAAEKIAPETGNLEQALALVGAATVDVFFESVAGKTMKLLTNKEPHRLFSAAVNGYPLAITADTRYYYERVGERTGVFRFEKELLGPLHHIGVFESATRQVCDVPLEVHLEQFTEFDFALRTSW